MRRIVTREKEQHLREAMHLQSMEDNPLDAQDKAMFEMFERKGWSPEKRRAYICLGPTLYPHQNKSI